MIDLLWLILIVSVIVWMTAVKGVHPFLALLFGSLAVGFLTGLNTADLLDAIAGGFGSTLSSIGIVIAAGAVIGEYLDRSGGAKVLANTILDKTGDKNAPLSMSLTGYIVSIPVFCDSGFIVLSALKNAIGKRTSISLATLAIALSTGLYTTHVFVPPTPGPLAAAATLGADVGRVLVLGLVVSVPVMIAGLLWANYYCSRYTLKYDFSSDDKTEPEVTPSFTIAIAPIFIPIIFIALKSIAEYPTEPFGTGLMYNLFTFLGHPVVALLIGVVLALFMVRGGQNRIQNLWMESALKKAGIIILITGAGGAFGEVLRNTELTELANSFTAAAGFGVIIPFLIASFLKSAQGSSTVAIITAAAICVPLLGSLGLESVTGKALAVLSIGAGALTVSHVNDSYFWVVAKFSNMDTATALKTHTIATLIMGVTGIITIQLAAWMLL